MSPLPPTAHAPRRRASPRAERSPEPLAPTRTNRAEPGARSKAAGAIEHETRRPGRSKRANTTKSREASTADDRSAPSADETEAFRKALLDWYARTRRRLPWRETPSAYGTWVSEIMLQQTQVSTVIDYFERWMRAFPSPRALAEADPESVLRAWEGLGYYSRARNLKRAAELIVSEWGGSLPPSARALQELPGIGRYTAAAIASIAFGEPAVALDGNLQRVLTRWRALRGDPRRPPLHERLWSLGTALVDPSAPGDFNQALMDLGATICTPREPACGSCPLRVLCQAHERGLVAQLPELAARPAPTPEYRAVALVAHDGALLVVQRPLGSGRWAGLWHFPDIELDSEDAAVEPALEQGLRSQLGLSIRAAPRLVRLTHAVTRYRVRVDAHDCALSDDTAPPLPSNARWVVPRDLMTVPMPTPHRKLAQAWLARRTP